MPTTSPDLLQPPAVASARDASCVPVTRFRRAGCRTSPRIIHRLVPTTSLGDRQCLVSRRRLARLPGAEDGDESIRSLGQPLDDRRHLRAPVGVAHSGSVASGITILSKVPQDSSRKCSRESSEGPRRSLHGNSRRRQRVWCFGHQPVEAGIHRAATRLRDGSVVHHAPRPIPLPVGRRAGVWVGSNSPEARGSPRRRPSPAPPRVRAQRSATSAELSNARRRAGNSAAADGQDRRRAIPAHSQAAARPPHEQCPS